MIQLPHTGLWVPTPTIAVTAVHENGDEHADAVRVASVHYDHTLLGYAVTAFVPTGPRAALVMEDFLDRAEVAEQGDTPPTPTTRPPDGCWPSARSRRRRPELNSGRGSGGSRFSLNRSRPPE